MKFLTGDTRSRTCIEWLKTYGFGRIWIDRKPTPYSGEPWGFDNGAYRDFLAGRQFDADGYRRRLDIAHSTGRIPYLAVVPDIVAGGERSLDFSLSWLPRLPAGWPWFLAIQDGMTLEVIDPVLAHGNSPGSFSFAGIFLGGTTEFKATAWHWATMAHAHGKLFHYGRAGTREKIWHAMAVEADSCDSAFPLWTAGRRPIVERSLRAITQPMLFLPEKLSADPRRFKT